MAVLLCVISSFCALFFSENSFTKYSQKMWTSVAPFSAKICVPMAVVDIVSLVTGLANQNALLVQQTGLFCLAKMCILSSLPFLGKNGPFCMDRSIFLHCSLQCAGLFRKGRDSRWRLVLASPLPFERGKWSFS